MSRLSRKHRTDKDLGILNKGGLLDLADNAFKIAFRITDDEYDYIAEHLTDEEVVILVSTDTLTFSEGKKMLEIVERLLKDYKAQSTQ